MGVPGLENQYKELDGQIESLMKCTPLPEAEVKVLCDKAREILQVWFPPFWRSEAKSAPVYHPDSIIPLS